MLQSLRTGRIVLAALVLAGVYPATVSAQEGGPLLKSDLVRMMTASNYTGTEMAAIVRLNCVGFDPTERDRNQLSSLRGSDLVMVEIDRCVSKPARNTRSNRVAGSPTPVGNRTVRTPPRPDSEITFADLEVEAVGSEGPMLLPPRSTSASQVTAVPSIARRTIKPRLTNWDEVTKAFMVEYRPAIRTPGSVVLSLTLGPDGNVLDTIVKQSTGDQAMAEAALRVVKVMKFEPAMIGDQAIKSVMDLPFNFATN